MGLKRFLALRKQLKREQLHGFMAGAARTPFTSSQQRATENRTVVDVGMCSLECSLANTQCHNKKERRRSAALSLTEVGFA